MLFACDLAGKQLAANTNSSEISVGSPNLRPCLTKRIRPLEYKQTLI